MKQDANSNIPSILVILGVTGDLVSKKIAPALFNLFREGQLPTMFKVVGFSRRDWTSDDLRKYIGEILAKRGENIKSVQAKKFLELFSYSGGHFEKKEGYDELKGELQKIDDEWGVCSNK